MVELNVIKAYEEIVEEHTDVPPIYAKAGAYHILSTCIGRFIRFDDWKLYRPNTWFIVCSIPGRMRRSTIQSLTDWVVSCSITNHYKYIDNRIIGNKYGEDHKILTQKQKDDDSTNKFYASEIQDGTGRPQSGRAGGGTSVYYKGLHQSYRA